MSVNSRKLFMLIYLLQFLGLSIQELVPLEEYDSCGVCPGTTSLYECAILGSTTTTVYEITFPDSTNCTLKLVNSRFLGSKDGCLDNLVLARANRIDGDKYISNVSVTVPNITFPTSSTIIIKCLSEEISDPVGTATLEIISSDGFNFPGEVDKNQENGTCAFSVKSSCTVDDYLPSSSCSNCSLNDNIFICDDVQLGKNCTFTVQAALCNFISVESDLAFCSRIGGSDLKEPDTEAVPLTGIVIPVVAIVVIIVICIATCILMIFVSAE